MASGDLASATVKVGIKVDDDPYFRERLAQWRAQRDIGVAAELVAIGHAHAEVPEILEAAREVSAVGEFDGTLLGDAARELLGWEKPATDEQPHGINARRLDRRLVQFEVARARQRAFSFPRHAYAWSDLARLYAVLGQNDKARKAFSTALLLAPNDRFVLRTAARFFVHADRKDEALHLLRGASATRVDPWLMSAEIAVSQSAGESSRLASRAFREIEGANWSHRSSSELRGSLATLLMADGAMSKARKSFRRSLIDPTENAVAQVQWATDRTSGLVVPADALAVPQNFEAHALRARSKGDWQGAIDACWDWAAYEPTSSRPMSLGSYVAALAFDGQATLEFAERGLEIDPDSAMFMNNKAVALARLGRLDEAVDALEGAIAQRDKPRGQHVFFLATMGLIYFRSGEVSTGRNFYEQAIELARPPMDPALKSLALWHLAREEAACGSSTTDSTVQRARDASKQWKDAAEIALFEKQIAGFKALKGTSNYTLPITEPGSFRRASAARRISEFAKDEDERI